jgi:RNA polymerase sigma-70 factor (ECF subfamily)
MTNSASNVVLPALLQSGIPAECAPPYLEELAGLFTSWRSPLLRYALTFGLEYGDGEEIVQETFLALFKHLQGGRSRENLSAWVFRVCHNLSLKHREKSSGVRSGPGTEAEWPDDLADKSPNPEEQLLQAQRRRKLQSVLRALTEQDRCCICLRAEGLRYREIAEILGMSLGSVSSSLTRSLARFERAEQE